MKSDGYPPLEFDKSVEDGRLGLAELVPLVLPFPTVVRSSL